MFNIVDENGKTLNVSFSDITDMTTDKVKNAITLNDAEKYALKDFKCEIVDEEGNSFDITKIRDNDSESLPYAIDVLFEATHSGINRNDWNYHSDSMEKDTRSWQAPFKKPLLKNHDMYTEPLGRVVDAYHGQSKLNEERDCIFTKFRVTDKDAIVKFLDGRYSTMSIGGSVGHVNCSICGKDILKDGVFKFCGHWRGENYKGQKAIWNARDIEYKEGSVVNSPADDWAQAVKITVINKKAEDDNTDSEEIKEPETTIVDNQEEDLASIIDKNIKAEDLTEVVKDDITEGATEAKCEEVKDTKEVETLKSTLADKEALIKTLNTEINDLKEKAVDFETKESALNDEVSKNTTRCLKLSIEVKKLMAERIALSQVINSEVSLEDLEKTKNELVSKSAKELTDISNKIILKINDENSDIEKKDEEKTEDAKTGNTEIAPVQSPGAANLKDSNSIYDDEEANKPKTEIIDKSYKEIEKEIIDSIFR